jgi:hypothetical protein
MHALFIVMFCEINSEMDRALSMWQGLVAGLVDKELVMNRTIGLVSLLFLMNCAHGDELPQSPYDPDVVQAAKEAVDSYDREDQALREKQVAPSTAECSRGSGGCEKGYVCWDSLQCSPNSQTQCSALGDKRCHRRCSNHADCLKSMPVCAEKPIFSGGQQGRLESFCVPR